MLGPACLIFMGLPSVLGQPRYLVVFVFRRTHAAAGLAGGWWVAGRHIERLRSLSSSSWPLMAKTKRNFLMVLSYHWLQCIHFDQTLESPEPFRSSPGLGAREAERCCDLIKTSQDFRKDRREAVFLFAQIFSRMSAFRSNADIIWTSRNVR
jgi:hypothetical protein